MKRGVSKMPRKTLTGTVVSNKSEKTIVVEVLRQVKHKKYHKTVKRSKRYSAHNPNSKSFNIGDTVKIIECAPVSKTKSWLIDESVS
jgi:small subunit ribosomal protein S17